MLVDKIRKDRMTAMKEKNVVAKSILTTLLGELETAAKRDQSDITDDMVIRSCKKFIASNNEVVELSTSNVDFLRVENALLEDFIPKQLTEDEIRAIIAAMNATNLGQIMQQLKAEHDGKYDGKLASTVARDVLALQTLSFNS